MQRGHLMGWCLIIVKRGARPKFALSACKQQNVKEVFCTLWLDDGAETLLETAYPGLSYFASQSYPSETGIDVTAEFFETLFKAHLNDFLSLNDFDCTPGVDKENITASHPYPNLAYGKIHY